MALVCALACAACACKASDPANAKPGAGTGSGTPPGVPAVSPAARAPGPGSAAADPWAAKDAAIETPATRKQRAEAALARVASIEPKLAKIRQLAFLRDVPTEYQSSAEFRAYLQRDIAKDLPPDKAKALSSAYAHLGLFKQPVDLAHVLEETMATQAGAYYDPAAKKFFLVMVPESDVMLDTMSAHELTHALTDQHFDLQQYLEPNGKPLDDDQSSARRFVGEGDATFAMLVYTMLDMLHQSALPPGVVPKLHDQVARFAGQDLASFSEMTKQQGALMGAMDPEIKKSIDAMQDLPPAVLVPLVASYTKGALVAMTAYQHGGWAAVDDLYKHPPESTEQMLHPETKLYPHRELPRRVALAATKDHEIANNVMGEMLWWVYLYLWSPKLADEASQGWGGDHYRVVEHDGRLIGTIATVWDTAADAAQFTAAYRASLAARFPGAKAVGEGVARPDGGAVLVRQIGARVYIVDGGDPATLDELIRTAKID
jgi:hypothetical protein